MKLNPMNILLFLVGSILLNFFLLPMTDLSRGTGLLINIGYAIAGGILLPGFYVPAPVKKDDDDQR